MSTFQNIRKGEIDFKIQQCKAEDAGTVVAILHECADWLASRGAAHWLHHHTIERTLHDIENGVVLLMKSKENAPLGTVTITTETPDYAAGKFDSFWSDHSAIGIFVKKLAVNPQFHSLDLGKHLMKEAEVVAAQIGGSFARLDLNPNVRGLSSYYQRQGYELRGEIDFALLFEKKLASASK